MSKDKPIKEIVSRNIKRYREQAGKFQKDLAEDIGININTLASYERGTREPSFDTIVKLADYFDVSLDDMFGRDLVQQEDIKSILDDLPDHIKHDFSKLLGELGELVRREASAGYERNCLQLYLAVFSYLNDIGMLSDKKLSELKEAYPKFDIRDPYKIAQEAHKDLLVAVSSDNSVEEFISHYHGSVSQINSAAYEVADKIYKIITLHLVNELIGKKEKGAD